MMPGHFPGVPGPRSPMAAATAHSARSVLCRKACCGSGSSVRHGVRHDQVLWSILASDGRLQRLSQEPTVH